MAEVYTISGFGIPTPEQMAEMEHQNAVTVQQQQAASRIPPAMLLQNALKALGATVGDSALSKLGIDGKIGPATTRATNHVFATYFNAPNVMSATYISQHINYLQTQVESYVKAHGGNIPPVWIGSKKPSTFIAPTPGSSPGTTTTDPSDNKWVWYVVGGVSILVVLAMVAKAVRHEPQQTAKA